MGRRIFDCAAGLSAALLVFAVLLGLVGSQLNPWDHYVSCHQRLHFGVWGRGGLHTVLVIFNDAGYGPYRGSLIQVVLDDGQAYPKLISERGYDAPGIYYRFFHFPDGTILWTLMLSVWYFMAGASIVPLIWGVMNRGRFAVGGSQPPRSPATSSSPVA